MQSPASKERLLSRSDHIGAADRTRVLLRLAACTRKRNHAATSSSLSRRRRRRRGMGMRRVGEESTRGIRIARETVFSSVYTVLLLTILFLRGHTAPGIAFLTPVGPGEP